MNEPHAASPAADALDAGLAAGFAAAPDATCTHQPTGEAVGTVVAGKYKLLEKIGEGGMGAVWVAEQTAPVKRKVALKLIKAGMDSRSVIARFEAERQALALMDHPNIAKVLDGGLTEAGRPFFAMELVKGVPITDYCDRCKLTPKERLELFVPVCQAIQHAHQKGIIHRDIKPSNVLIALFDDRAVVKVIDFGVAKATGGTLTEHTLETGFGAVVGTPEYMSPEQATFNNLDIDTRSDVYALGAVLYELLTGSPPFSRKELEKHGLLEMLRVVREEEPPRPSTKLSTADALPTLSAKRGTEPRKLTALMRNELDWIVMKALDKDRTRRYATANGFAADVQRYLAGEPVIAHPPSTAYRMKKFLRRHRGQVLAAGVVLFTLVASLTAGTAGIVWHQDEVAERARQDLVREAAEERKQAQRDTEEALRVAAADRKKALAEAAVRQALDQAEQGRAELHAILHKPGGVFGLLNDPKRWQADIRAARASLERGQALLASAGDGVDPELGKRAAALDTVLDRDEADRRLAVRLEKVRMDPSAVVNGSFDYARAAKEYPKVFAEADMAILKDEPAPVVARLRASPIREQLVAALDDWAFVAFRVANDRVPELILKIGRLAAPDPAWGDRLRQVGLWRDQEALGRLVKDAPTAGLSAPLLQLVGKLLHEDNPLWEPWRRQAQAQYPNDFWLNLSLGTALGKSNPVEAAGYFRVALAVRPDSSVAYNNLGNALWNQKRLPEAIAACRKAIDIDPKYAFAYNNLGNALSDQKRLPDAIAAYRMAIDLDPKCAFAYANLGNALRSQKRLPEAIEAHRKAIDIDPKFAGAYNNLGNAFRDQKRLPEAIEAYRMAIDLDPKHAFAYNNLGNALRDQKRLPEAIDAYRAAIEVDSRYAVAYANLGIALGDQQRLPEAIAAFRKAIEIDSRHASAYANLGNALRNQNRLPEAIEAYRKAIDIDPKFAGAYYSLGLALRDQKQLPEAIAAYHKAIEIDPKFAWPYYNLGNALRDQKRLPEAIDAYRAAIEIASKHAIVDPKYADAYSNLGNAPPLAWLYNNLGVALRHSKRLPEAIAAYRKAIEIDPKHANAYGGLGVALFSQKQFPEAIAAFRKAIEINPRFAGAYNDLGNALREQKQLPDAIAAYRKAVEIDPNLAMAYDNLGNALRDQKRLPEAIAAFRKAIEIDSRYALAYHNLGGVFRDKKQLPDAIAAFRKAIDIDPKLADAYVGLGFALFVQKQFPEAIAAFRKAVDLDPKSGMSHGGLGFTLGMIGRFAEATQSLQKCLGLLPTTDSRRPAILNALHETTRLHGLAQRLPRVLEGTEKATPGELLQMADMCQQYQQRHATAVRLYQDAFDAKPALAQNAAGPNRYTAACAAALAGTGQGEEAAKLQGPQKTKLREQARAWLRADLDGYAKRLRDSKPVAVLQAEQQVSRWQADADLAGVRTAEQLAGLPTEERECWNQLWADVAGLLKEARSRFTDTRFAGALTAKKNTHLYPWNLVAGRTYVIDLESAAFDTLLKLERPDGKLLAENDVVPGVNLNSRLVFTAPADGVYRLIATSFEQRGNGAYSLRIREFNDKTTATASPVQR